MDFCLIDHFFCKWRKHSAKFSSLQWNKYLKLENKISFLIRILALYILNYAHVNFWSTENFIANKIAICIYDNNILLKLSEKQIGKVTKCCMLKQKSIFLRITSKSIQSKLNVLYNVPSKIDPVSMLRITSLKFSLKTTANIV